VRVKHGHPTPLTDGDSDSQPQSLVCSQVPLEAAQLSIDFDAPADELWLSLLCEDLLSMLHSGLASFVHLIVVPPVLRLDFPQRVELAVSASTDCVFLHALQIAAMILMLVVIESDAEFLSLWLGA